MLFLFAMNFFARSKKASSSGVATVVVVGGIGSGSAGVRVGETAGPSGTTDCFALCVVLVRFGKFWLASCSLFRVALLVSLLARFRARMGLSVMRGVDNEDGSGQIRKLEPLVRLYSRLIHEYENDKR